MPPRAPRPEGGMPERSCSKLGLIKTHLRSAMEQLRLTHLVILSIEHEMTETVDSDDKIGDFTLKEARGIVLQ